ncbi:MULTISPECIES: hypothetical protein [unclassified Imperialibacter]|uniref:hypothetical protein n=1 Tax=unclassified Imperialibacter TaxID=2629706 RepID=UPI00125C7B8E|nr:MULTISPECIES: hypothetical protein [unclassified Imperialibacter]CAD5290267.1 conserved hypothetical protein [Imperialibacter sp. 89]CAD5290567.1 conserved hypothetical protein [Imperialibacter sp. 75]VVT34478.1 conserved hypothetical protein [Imperialibacter sp. EC-SDR9]
MANKKVFTFKIGENWKVVVLAVLAATTFWFFNSLNKNYEARLSYPIAFDFPRDSVVIVKPLPDEVRIDVASGGWNLLRKTFWFNVDPLVIQLDNPTEIKFLTRNSLYDIIKDQLTDIDLNRVVTDTLFISVEPKIQKMVMAVVDSLTIPLATNYRLTSPITYEPDSVRIEGPSSLMNRFPSTWLLEFDRSDIAGDFERSLAVPLTDNRLMSSTPKSVTVKFRAEEFIRDSLLVEIQPVNFPNRYRGKVPYLADTVTYVFYTIKGDLASQVSDSAFSIAADFKMYNSEDSTITPVVLFRPTEVLELQLLPEKLKVGHANQ